jgi:hypothetical protein
VISFSTIPLSFPRFKGKFDTSIRERLKKSATKDLLGLLVVSIRVSCGLLAVGRREIDKSREIRGRRGGETMNEVVKTEGQVSAVVIVNVLDIEGLTEIRCVAKRSAAEGFVVDLAEYS